LFKSGAPGKITFDPRGVYSQETCSAMLEEQEKNFHRVATRLQCRTG